MKRKMLADNLTCSRNVIIPILAIVMLIVSVLALNAFYFSTDASKTVNEVNTQLGFFSESQLLENPSDWFTTGQAADLMLGPVGLEESGGPSFLNHPMGVATDGARLFVADTCNNRVLIWNSIPTTNYAPADIVVGQPDFTSSVSRGGQNGLNWPVSVAVAGSKLFVADTGNNRILIWNSIPTTNFAHADVVVGRHDFETCEDLPHTEFTKDLLRWPWGVWSDGTRLFVADTRVGRVLVWNAIPTENGAPADLVLGKFDFEHPYNPDDYDPLKYPELMVTPRGIRSDGNRLIINDHDGWLRIWNTMPTTNGTPCDFIAQYSNSETEPGFDGNRILVAQGHGILVWNSITDFMDNKSPNVILGNPSFPGVSRDKMLSPRSIATDGQYIIVAERYGSRVLIWNNIPTENYTLPDIVLGQPDFDTNMFLSQVGVDQIAGINTDGTNLLTAHSGEARIMIWKSLPEIECQPADLILGWSDFDPAYRIAGPGMVDGCGIFSDGTRVFATDTARSKVLIWNTFPTVNGQPPDVEFGRSGEAGRYGLNQPFKIASDGKRLVVADWFNNRVLIWNTIPQENDAPADLVVGQPDFNSTEPRTGLAGLSQPISVFTDGKRLYVGERGPPCRILIWNTFPTQNGQPADIEIVTFQIDSLLCGLSPYDIFSDGDHLFATDNSGNRVFIWNTIPTSSNQAPDIVLGQPNFNATWASISRYGLNTPTCVSFDGIHLWVGETTWSHRVLRFSIPNPKSVILKPPFNVKANSMTLIWSQATRDDFTRYEVHMSTEPGFTPTNETLLVTITDRANTSYTVSGLSLNTIYYFKIRSYYTDGLYGDSVQRWATTLAEQPPYSVWNFEISAEEKNFTVQIMSNGTISEFEFLQTDRKIAFNITGSLNKVAFCNVTIPRQLLDGPFSIRFDDVPITDVIENWNETHTMLHFTITLSQHKIEIIGTSVIPEFSSPLILAPFITATILIVILNKKDSHRNHRQHKENQ